MKPSRDELQEWANIAARRNAILPDSISIHKRDITIVCGQCHTTFVKKLLPGRNDPVFVCPACKSRNYAPVEW